MRTGGGVVFFVNEMEHDYITNVEELEEAGTPGILQDIRTGLAVQLREAIGCQTIMEREEAINQKFIERVFKIDNIVLLGNNRKPKVCIYAFLIKSKYGKFLHPQFVIALLNDLFGIQGRSGCNCASLYGQHLLQINVKLSREYKEAFFAGNEVLRMGFSRINVHYFLHEDELEYILEALEFIATYGWMFLPHYEFDQESGSWTNKDAKDIQMQTWLGKIDYSKGYMDYSTALEADRKKLPFIPIGGDPGKSKPLSEYIREAKFNLVKVVENYKKVYAQSELDQKKPISEPYQKLVWFLFPNEVLIELLNMKYSLPLTFKFLESHNQLNPQNCSADTELPFGPKDLNHEKMEFKFSQEYLE